MLAHLGPPDLGSPGRRERGSDTLEGQEVPKSLHSNVRQREMLGHPQRDSLPPPDPSTHRMGECGVDRCPRPLMSPTHPATCLHVTPSSISPFPSHFPNPHIFPPTRVPIPYHTSLFIPLPIIYLRSLQPQSPLLLFPPTTISLSSPSKHSRMS